MIPDINKRYKCDILYIRQCQDISQKQLAESLDIPRYKLSYLENGHYLPTVELLDKIKKELGCLVSDLYSLEIQKVIMKNHKE